jgi:bifunctional DNA-binding transcriptional regulator/antitoxin component of YhaV-PrlF toxin-antitoxin module
MYDDLVSLQENPQGRPGGASFRVSGRGQLSLPAEVRRRWGIEDGGSVEMIDLGTSVLLIPGGAGTLRRMVGEIVTPELYEELLQAIDDPDLADQ